jgi:hypothetical protein
VVAVGESGTTEIFSVSATGAGRKDWRTVEASISASD